MTYETFLSYIEQPEKLSAAQIPEIKELMEKYPYFGTARWLYLRALKNTNSLYFGAELGKTAVFAPNRRNLYFFIHPEELETKSQRERPMKDGSYFDMMDKLNEGEDENRQSLKSLAERLKTAREKLQTGK